MSAAMRLSGSGLRVVVLERMEGERFDRYHSICGEAVSDRALRRAGWIPSSETARVDAIRISTVRGTSVDVPVRGRIIDRPAVLAEMRGLTDAEFVRGDVSSVSETEGGYEVSMSDGRTVRCRWLIGADGAHSAVRRCLFGTRPRGMMNIENCIAGGDGGSVLEFTVGETYRGCYAWRFPSKPGTVSVGFAVGTGSHRDVEGLASWGARALPFGPVPEAAKGRCILAGDAAGLPNPLCYGGIGAAMLSGRRAAEAVLKGDAGGYVRWVRRDRMFDPRFMDARAIFSEWTDDDIEDALAPLAGRFSPIRGLRAVLRRPEWTRVYIGVLLALRIGWRRPRLGLRFIPSDPISDRGGSFIDGDSDSRLRCSRCLYEWVPRKDSPPLRCPRCRSVKWSDQSLRLECRRCGHVWNSRDGNPKRCPSCGSYRWMDEPRGFECARCGYSWESKTSKVPSRCPSCFSRAWSDEPAEEAVAVDTSLDGPIAEMHREGRSCVEISIGLGISYARARSAVERLFPGMHIRRRRSGSSFLTLSILLTVSMYLVCSMSAALRRSAICSWQVLASSRSLSASSKS